MVFIVFRGTTQRREKREKRKGDWGVYSTQGREK